MSEELENVCENCNFNNNFKEFIAGVERHYISIANEEKQYGGDAESLTMFEWIVQNTKINELSCLSEKEKFLYGLGVLSSEIMHY